MRFWMEGCRACGELIHERDDTCPLCGIEYPTKSSIGWSRPVSWHEMILFALGLAVLLGVLTLGHMIFTSVM